MARTSSVCKPETPTPAVQCRGNPRPSGRGGCQSFTVETYATDSFEPNEEFTNATRISPDTTRSGQTPIGDTDWFTFEAEAGETINLTGSVPAGDDPDKMRIYTAEGARSSTWMTEARISGGETQSIGITAPYTGTYYVRVLYDFGSPSEYNFTLETYRTEAIEPNEDRGNATQLFENPFTPAEAQISIGDHDYFEYDLAAGETLRVEGGAAPAVNEHQFRLRRPGGERANTIKIAGGTIEVGELTAQSSGTHYIEVRQGSGFDTGPYNVTITAGGRTVGPPNDRFETANPPVGNQNQQNAAPIDSGTYGNLGMVDDDRDVFEVRAAKDARVTANVSYDGSADDLSLELTDASGATVATGGDGLAVNVSSAGTYYLEVTGRAGTRVEYALELNVSAVGPVGPPALPGQSAAPIDPDGDGLYEDLDGDERLTVIDVSILLDVFDRVPAGEVGFYDYDDNGRLNIVDVATLLAEA